MAIRLTEDQWAEINRELEVPARVSDPAQITTFVLIRSDAYERIKALFEDVPVTEQERRSQLQQFGKRAGWDDPAMDVYEDLDPAPEAMTFKRGDIVLVDYPYSDGTGSKIRPALVVQTDHLNQRIDDTILAAISRSAHRASATQLFIDLNTPDGRATGLRQDSMVQCENLLTFDQRRILATIGTLTAPLQQQIDACLRNALEL